MQAEEASSRGEGDGEGSDAGSEKATGVPLALAPTGILSNNLMRPCTLLCLEDFKGTTAGKATLSGGAKCSMAASEAETRLRREDHEDLGAQAILVAYSAARLTTAAGAVGGHAELTAKTAASLATTGV